MKTKQLAKRHYEKPSMRVYLLHSRQHLLQASMPIGDDDDYTNEQW